MEDNLLANFVRETGDHGPFNVGDYDSARTPPCARHAPCARHRVVLPGHPANLPTRLSACNCQFSVQQACCCATEETPTRRQNRELTCLRAQSWDRSPYLTTFADPDGKTASLKVLWNQIRRNFYFSNYHSTWPIDHDDGKSSFFFARTRCCSLTVWCKTVHFQLTNLCPPSALGNIPQFVHNCVHLVATTAGSSYYNDTNNFCVYGGYKVGGELVLHTPVLRV